MSSRCRSQGVWEEVEDLEVEEEEDQEDQDLWPSSPSLW